MKYYTLLIVAIILMTLIGLPAFADSPEVKSAKEFVTTHNEAIELADKELQETIERAKAKHRFDLIKAKERLIYDLRKSLRLALKSEEPENSVVISQQINRLKEQVALLKDGNKITQKEVAEVAEVAEVKPKLMEGLDPNLVGYWKLNQSMFAIFPDGTMYYEKYRDPAAQLDGKLLQMTIVDEMATASYTRWSNRKEQFKIEDGKIVMFHTTSRGSVGRHVFEIDMTKDIPQHIVDAANKLRKGQEPESKPESKPEQVKEEEPLVEDKEEGNTKFFGIPVK